MKEELYKYLSIGLLALLLLVCFGSLITYFVVGQESINNVAHAGYVIDTGYAPDNLFTNNWCEDWSYNVDATGNTILNPIVFYEDDTWAYSIYGGTLVNNHMSSNSHIVLTLKKNFDASGKYVHFLLGVSMGYTLSNMSVSFHSINYNASTTYVSSSSSYSWGGSTKQDSTARDLSIGSYFIINCTGSNGYLRFICLQVSNANNQSGYVPKTYSNYGYDQGYTDGVNSSSGGTSDIPLDLTNVTWRSPSVATVSNVDGLYDVTGSLDSSYTGSSFTFDKIQLVSGNTIFGEDGEYSPMYLIDSSIVGASGIIPVMASELLTFTGGDDVANSELIEWLQDNNGFLSYTDGYQEGYNSGYDIGYHEGYEQGNTDTIVTLDTYLQPFGSSTFTGVINQDPTTFWWSVQPGMQPNTAVYGYLCFNISSLPIGSIVHFNFPFQKYIVKDNSNVEHEITDIRVLYDVDYYTNLLISPRDSLPSIRLQQGVGTYSFNVIRPGDTIVLYFPLNMVTDFNRYTFGLSWEGDEYNYSFTTSSISLDLQTQLDNAYERGLTDGNSQGYTNGYTVGYNQGADGAEHYTFNNLLGAVFDAPITMFLGKYNSQTGMREGGLFNFELLGVNLSGFVIALLSIGVVLFIMRLFLRGL